MSRKSVPFTFIRRRIIDRRSIKGLNCTFGNIYLQPANFYRLGVAIDKKAQVARQYPPVGSRQLLCVHGPDLFRKNCTNFSLFRLQDLPCCVPISERNFIVLMVYKSSTSIKAEDIFLLVSRPAMFHQWRISSLIQS